MKITPSAFLRALALGAFFATAAFATDAGPATQPAPRDPKWVKRHEGFVEIAKRGGVDVLFLGDSITDFWRSDNPKKGGKAVWDANFAPLHAENFGISGDRTQHVLWRIQNGELDGLHPKVIVLMIGTNNTGFEKDGVTPRNRPAEVIEGVGAVVGALRSKRPEAKILLLAIFPRDRPGSVYRRQIQEINAGIARLDDGKSVRFLDIGSKFLEPDGTLPTEIMPDLLHPGEKGYEIWAAAIKEPLAELLN